MQKTLVDRVARGMLLIACGLGASPRAGAEVRILVGTAAGRTAKAGDPAIVNEPFAVSFDTKGRMYGVEFTRGNRLFRVDDPSAAKPVVTFVAGEFHVTNDKTPPLGDAATEPAKVRFNGPHDVAVAADGMVYVADTFSHQIRAFDAAMNTVRLVAGTGVAGYSGDGGPATKATFRQAYCGSLTPDGKALFVADIGNAVLRRIDLVNQSIATVVGNGKRGKPADGTAPLDTPLAGPRAACVAADGTIYLALREGNALLEIKPGREGGPGRLRTVVNAAGKGGYSGDGGPGRDAQLAGPKYVALDARGRVLIADTENHCIRRYDPATERIELVAGIPRQPGAAVGNDLLSTQLKRPHGCCVDPQGRLVVVDSENDRVLAAAEGFAAALPRGHDYFVLRNGLQNSRSAFEKTRRGRVVFLGGSITAGGGWRDQVCAWLRERFPDTAFEFVNAGIGSLGSVPHAFRLERDVLSHGPVDLLFVEAAVNDTANGTDADRMRRAMEGVVRHVRSANPLTDIVHLHFVMPEHMADYRAGAVPAAIREHERVAEAYGNPSLNLALEVTERIDAGQFTWEGDFKNLHPSPFGHRLYAASIGRMLTAACGQPPAEAPRPHPLPTSLDEASYGRGRLVPVSTARIIEGFRVEDAWKPTDKAGTRAGFVGVPALVGTQPGAAFEFDVEGTAAGIFITSGPDAGRIECSVDGGAFRTIETFTRWSSGLHLPWAVVLADGLPPGRHTVRVRVAADHDAKGAGTAVRVFHLLAN